MFSKHVYGLPSNCAQEEHALRARALHVEKPCPESEGTTCSALNGVTMEIRNLKLTNQIA